MTENEKKDIVEHLMQFTQEGINLEEDLKLKCDSINEKSETLFDQRLIESRIILISIFYDLTQIPTVQSEKNTESVRKRLNLIATYIKGMSFEKDAISYGLYTKASTMLKQSFEILTRILEVKKGVEKEGQTPQVKNLPKEFRKFNGHINKIAHPSKSDIISKFLTKFNHKGDIYISYLPSFIPQVAKTMYSTHILFMYSIIYEKIVLLVEVNGNDIFKVMKERKIIDYMKYVSDNLVECGVIGIF